MSTPTTYDFNASLLREKFVIRDVTAADEESGVPIIALSNRIALLLGKAGSDRTENLVIRAQNMHSCARFAARLAQDFQEHGPLLNRLRPKDWDDMWQTMIKGYEATWNPHRWVAVYHKGRVVYESAPARDEGGRHAFLDIIEQCEAVNTESYEKSIKIAEDAFKKAGKFVNIEYDSNVALVMGINETEGKCGIIVRGPARTTTFNFIAKPRRGNMVKPSQCLSAAAAFLEGIQLAFFVGMTNTKQQYTLIDKLSDNAKQGREAAQKLGRLNIALEQFENMLEIMYRPDRPDFAKMIDEAEIFARKVLAAEIERKIAAGELDSKDWVQ